MCWISRLVKYFNLWFNHSWIEANVDGISASKKSSSAGATRGLRVVRLQPDARPGQPVQGGHDDGGVVPGHVVVAEVIRYHDHNVGRRRGRDCCTGDQENYYMHAA